MLPDSAMFPMSATKATAARRRRRPRGRSETAPHRRELGLAPTRGRDDHRPGEKREQRDGRHLPVPVDGRVDEIRDVAAEGRGDERMPACPDGGNERHAEEQRRAVPSRQHPARRASAGRGCAFRHEVGGRTMRKPPAAKPPSPDADYRMRQELPPRRVPEHRAPSLESERRRLFRFVSASVGRRDERVVGVAPIVGGEPYLTTTPAEPTAIPRRRSSEGTSPTARSFTRDET